MLAAATVALAQDRPAVSITRVSAPPRLEQFDAAHDRRAAGMTPVEGLVQRTPVDGAPVSERTVVYLGYDDRHLYAVFVCATPEGGVRARRANRDRLPDDDDSVALQLDTFRDGRRLYGFQVNPAGVQVDGVYTEGAGWDLSFDAPWTAETDVRADGYLVLITVPFSSLRFPDQASQRWGVFLMRDMPRKTERAFWPAYSVTAESRVRHAANLDGLTGIAQPRTWEIQPYASARGETVEAGGLARAAARAGALGVDLKAVLRSNVVVDATVNPDFSQLEADAPQTTVNRRFEVFFPERRPFFIENASYFETPLPVLFTRRIRDPQAGARVSGKSGRYAFGALVADDRSDGPGGRDVVTALRASRDFGRDSQAGGLYVARATPHGDSHVAGADARVRLAPQWSAAGAMFVSADDTSASDRPLRGLAAVVSLQGRGRHFDYALAVSDLTPDFRAATGFVPRVGVLDVSQTVRVWRRPSKGAIVAWGPGLVLRRVWEHGGRPLDDAATLDVTADLRRNTSIVVEHTAQTERVAAAGGGSGTAIAHRATTIGVSSAPHRFVTFQVLAEAGTRPNLTPGAGVEPRAERLRRTDATVTLSPWPALTIQTAHLFESLGRHTTGERVFEDSILRSRWNYQFTRRLSARLTIDRHHLVASSRWSALTPGRTRTADLLVTYLVQPGTVVFVGANVDEREVADRRRGTALFFKLSYRLRM